jgi:hypothetical protein
MRSKSSTAVGREPIAAGTQASQEPLLGHLCEEHRLALARLLASRTLERSPRLRAFLEHIAACLEENRLEDMKEMAIGCAVFGRSTGYNHAEDNVVRVTARQLRAKMAEYYGEEGEDDPWLVVIPRGTYVPEFHPREPVQATADSPLPPVPVTTRQARGPFAVRWTWAMASAIVLVLLASAVVVLGWQVSSLRARLAPQRHTILALLLPEYWQRLNIIVADSSAQLYRHLSKRDVPFGMYANRQFLLPEQLPEQIPYGSSVWTYLRDSRTTDFTNVSVVAHLLSVLPADRVTVRHASQVSSRDFLKDNAILISSSAANPWVHFFEGKLVFRIERDSQTGEQIIRNTAPKPGEPPVFRGSANAGAKVTFGRVALLPNLAGTGRVLLISGPSPVSTEAAAAFLSNAARSAELLALFGAKSLSQVGNFELVFEVVSSERVPTGTRIAAYRTAAAK